MKFLAFISYKHGSNIPLAARLASSIKSYAWPILRLPPRIFRDEDLIVPNNELPEVIKEALRQSKFLILIADPDSAKSVWVKDELLYWCHDLKRKDNLIIVLSQGSIAFDEETKEIDWEGTDALPRYLERYIRYIPFFIDLSYVNHESQLSLQDIKFKKSINAISARLRDVSPEDLMGEEIRLFKRALWIRNGVSATLALLLGVAVYLYQRSSSALSEYERLADSRRLSNARAEADVLWPISPVLVTRLDEWREKYADLAQRLPSHRSALQKLRASADPYTAEDHAVEIRVESEQLRLARRDRDYLGTLLQRQPTTEERNDIKVRIETLSSGISMLETAANKRRTWKFSDDNTQFRHDALAQLVSELELFEDTSRGLLASIAKRRELSTAVRDATIDQWQTAWEDARSRVHINPLYKGLSITPQLGLIPLGPDPESKLEEFLHWQSHSGAITRRDSSGELIRSSDTGIILILVPPGKFWMGAQKQNIAAPNYDPCARDDESPVREVELLAYFISKFEMTQEQWLRSTDEPNPSFYPPGLNKRSKQVVNLMHPVEQISWHAATQVLQQLGLALPTEAQWERAARAGSSMLYAGTSDESQLNRVANLAGNEAKEIWPSAAGNFTDPYIIHSEVGKFLPNGFGLFDMTGNVFEWCRDHYSEYIIDPREGDGLRESLSKEVVDRGGGFAYEIELARISTRNKIDPSFREYSIGVRPSRALQ